MDSLPDQNENRGPETIIIMWILIPIALLFVSLRMCGRLALRQVGADDYVMVFTLVSPTGHLV